MMNLTEQETKNIRLYIDFLLDYNNKINLIGKSTINDIWNRHVVDCLQLIKFIENKDIKLADLGSGAGLPGIILSIAGVKEVYLFEKSIRKCEFLEKAKKFSPNKIIVRNEDISKTREPVFDVITSRALADLDTLLNFSQNLKKKDTKLLFLKGKKIYEEINEAEKKWKINYRLIDSATSTEGKIIEIKNFNAI